MRLGAGVGLNRRGAASEKSRALALFAGGVPGYADDLEDWSTLFQDAAGTQPVTALEQPVGLILDKSRGLVLGPELVSNGDFSNGTTGYTPTSGNVGGSSVINGELNVVAGASGSGGFYQDITVVQGATYLLSVKARRISGSGSIRFQAFDGAAFTTLIRQFFDITTTGAAVTYSAYIRTSSTTTIRVYLYADTSTTGGFDDVTLKALPGNHAVHKPGDVLARATISRRVNLLTKTEQFDDAAWVKNSTTVTANAVVSPDGTTTADVVTHTAASGELINAGSISELLVAGKYTFSTYVKYVNNQWLRFVVGTGAPNNNCSGWVDIQNGIVGSTINNGSATNAAISIQNVGNGWYRCSLTGTLPTGSTTGYVSIMAAASDASNTRVSGGAWSCWGASLVPADLSSLPYQRVNTTTDYDSDASKYPTFLRTDGVDDGYQTASIDFSATDKMTVVAGVRKLSDAATGLIAEISADATTNNGAFSLYNSSTTTVNGFGFFSRGTNTSAAPVTSGYPPPVTSVLSGLGNISGDSSILRINGAQAASSAAEQGTGNYGNYPLFLFRRGGASLPFNGWYFGSFIIGKQLTASELALVERVHAAKTKTVSLA